MDQRFPFTSYDFWAYLAAGFLMLFVADYVAGTALLMRKDWSWVEGAVAVSCAYVVGHIVASLSSFILERGLVRLLGYPRHVVFADAKPGRAARALLGAYYTALPLATQRAVLDKGKAVGIDKPGEALFWLAYDSCRARTKVMDRLENFLNMYGFCRNLSLVCLVDAALLTWSYHFGGGPALHGNLALLAFAAAVGMTLRYLKFYRQYSVEVFTAFAHVKETKQP